MRAYPGRLYHETPGWVRDGALFHIRLRATTTQSSLIEPALGRDLLTAVRRYHDLGHWWCELFLLMPDHAHAILAFSCVPGMTITLRNWKRGTKRFQRVDWQEGFFDHRLRDEKETTETWHYIRRNPVIKKLCAGEDAWPWWWSSVVPNTAFEGGAA
jgi:putative transposase